MKIYEYRYTAEEYEAIASHFVDDSDWLIDVAGIDVFLRYIFDELKKRNLGEDFFNNCLEALNDAGIIVREDDDIEDGSWDSFIDQDGTKTFILSEEEVANFKKKIIREYGNKKRSPISHALRHKIFTRDDYRCKYCNSGYDLVVDHIYPHSMGGADSEDNLQTLCRKCNSEKGSKVFKET